MTANLVETTDRYESLLADAVAAVEVDVPADTALGEAARDFEAMARSYLEDGRHFKDGGEDVDALAAFSYGHAWLDAGARLGLFDVPTEGELFAV